MYKKVLFNFLLFVLFVTAYDMALVPFLRSFSIGVCSITPQKKSVIITNKTGNKNEYESTSCFLGFMHGPYRRSFDQEIKVQIEAQYQWGQQRGWLKKYEGQQHIDQNIFLYCQNSIEYQCRDMFTYYFREGVFGSKRPLLLSVIETDPATGEFAWVYDRPVFDRERDDDFNKQFRSCSLKSSLYSCKDGKYTGKRSILTFDYFGGKQRDLMIGITYKNGLRNGPYTVWSFDDQHYTERAYYKNNLLHGDYITYNPKFGVELTKTTYKDGNPILPYPIPVIGK